MYRIYLLTVTLIFSLSVFSLGAANPEQEHNIIVKKIGGGFALGIVISDPDDDDLEDLNIKGGAKILDVIEDSEAQRIGLKEDDVVINYDGQKIESARSLNDLVEALESEKKVKLVVLRDGKKETFQATLKPSEGEKELKVDIADNIQIEINEDHMLPHKFEFFGENEFISGADEKGAFLGVSGKSLTKQMLDYFEVDYGVLIEEITEKSPAEKAGLKAGDVIVKINDKKIEDFSDLQRTMNYYDPGDKVKIEFSRKGSKKSLSVELGKKKHHKSKFKIWHSDDNKSIHLDGDAKKHIIKKRIQRPAKAGKIIENIELELFII